MASTSDFVMSDSTWNSPFKGFKKEAKQAPSSQPTPGPQPNTARQSSVQAGPKPDTGTSVDFNQLSDTDKMCFHIACTRYKGSVDPQQWAEYWAQKEGLPVQNLTTPATYIYNIVRDAGAQSVDYVQDKLAQFPWWSASRDWNPELFRGYSGPQLQGLLDGVMPGIGGM